MKPKFCEICNYEVEKRGKFEPHWVHLHGSVFCMTTVATVEGQHFIMRENEPCYCGMTSPGSLCYRHDANERNRKEEN